jgi:hypothetical protein
MMPTYIVKLEEDEYVMFSTISERPASKIHTRAEAVAAGWTEPRMERADAYGASVNSETLRPDEGRHIDHWLAEESLNDPDGPWTSHRIRREVGYVTAPAMDEHVRKALHDCWAALAHEHERNHPLPSLHFAIMREAWSALGNPGVVR